MCFTVQLAFHHKVTWQQYIQVIEASEYSQYACISTAGWRDTRPVHKCVIFIPTCNISFQWQLSGRAPKIESIPLLPLIIFEIGAYMRSVVHSVELLYTLWPWFSNKGMWCASVNWITLRKEKDTRIFWHIVSLTPAIKLFCGVFCQSWQNAETNTSQITYYLKSQRWLLFACLQGFWENIWLFISCLRLFFQWRLAHAH